MGQLLDILVFTGLLSALFCVLGAIARIFELTGQKYRLVVRRMRIQPTGSPGRSRTQGRRRSNRPQIPKPRGAGLSPRVHPRAA
jgi:hypothetical protein